MNIEEVKRELKILMHNPSQLALAWVENLPARTRSTIVAGTELVVSPGAKGVPEQEAVEPYEPHVYADFGSFENARYAACLLEAHCNVPNYGMTPPEGHRPIGMERQHIELLLSALVIELASRDPRAFDSPESTQKEIERVALDMQGLHGVELAHAFERMTLGSALRFITPEMMRRKLGVPYDRSSS